VPMVEEQLRSVAQSGVSAVVRPSTNDTAQIKRLLDMGAQKLLVPMIDTREDTLRAAEAVRYPPVGIRGVSSAIRANRWS